MEQTPPPPLESNSLGSPPLVVPRATTDLQIVSLLHKHPLIRFTGFASGWCRGCNDLSDDYIIDEESVGSKYYIYGGYRCNTIGCGNGDVVFHKECAKPLQEINHSSHPQHPLKLKVTSEDTNEYTLCSICGMEFKVGYCCSICDFNLDLMCVRRPEPLVLPANSYGHEHPLQLFCSHGSCAERKICIACPLYVNPFASHYRCHQCKFDIHVDCVDLFPEAYHSSHPQHPLKSLKSEVPRYSDKKCLLCEEEFDKRHHQLHHCDVCNFSICRACMRNPPPVNVECPTSHEHQLHLFPRRIDFTCNACGTHGDRSPYFCLQCNFVIHRQCIDLPRIININRHDHRISYTRRLGYGEWKCRVCREKVDGFCGAYTCVKCPKLATHSLCATRNDVWDMVEREGTPEEEDEIAPFEVIDDTTIKHFSHDHNLQINKDGLGRVVHESSLCVACVFQICSEPFYSCEQCDFILHEKCAHLPRKKRHVRNNQPFTLVTDARNVFDFCHLCNRSFTGFMYKSGSDVTIDVRCGSTSDSIEHESHEHPLYYYDFTSNCKCCSQCGNEEKYVFGCSECDYYLDYKCALLPKKVMKKRYDDHPLFLCFGNKDADGEYWCEACETKVDPKKWFYTCNDCGITLHISCIVGDFSYILPGSVVTSYVINLKVVSNISICRPLCFGCKSRCKLPSILKISIDGDDVYVCSYECGQRVIESKKP